MLWLLDMYRRTPLVSGEIYHIFNRGAHKQNIFTSENDYARFKILLHLANNSKPIHVSNIFQKYKNTSYTTILENEPADHALVDVLAYALMPNHFHLILRQKEDDGITLFMKKMMTAYSMYFNIRYEHSGVLFQGRFKSSHASNEEYLRYLFAYIHLNPIEIIDKNWKDKKVSDKNKAKSFLNSYSHSSYLDYIGKKRAEEKILSSDSVIDFSAETSFEELCKLVEENYEHDGKDSSKDSLN